MVDKDKDQETAKRNLPKSTSGSTSGKKETTSASEEHVDSEIKDAFNKTITIGKNLVELWSPLVKKATEETKIKTVELFKKAEEQYDGFMAKRKEEKEKKTESTTAAPSSKNTDTKESSNKSTTTTTGNETKIKNK